MTFELTGDGPAGGDSQRGHGQDFDVVDLLALEPGERLWKLYVFRPASGRETRLEHRIYSKIKPDGHLALLTFALHRPAEGHASHSGVARVPDLTAGALDHIIETIRREQADADEYEEIDVSDLPTVAEQLAEIRERLEDGRQI